MQQINVRWSRPGYHCERSRLGVVWSYDTMDSFSSYSVRHPQILLCALPLFFHIQLWWHNNLGPLQQKGPHELQFESNPKIGLIGGFVCWLVVFWVFFSFLGFCFGVWELCFIFSRLGCVQCFRLRSNHSKGSADATERWCLSRNKHLKARPPTALLAGEEAPSKEGFVKLYLWLAIVKDKKELLYLLYFWMVVSEQGKEILKRLTHSVKSWSKFHLHYWNYLNISNRGNLYNTNTLSPSIIQSSPLFH